MYFQHCAKILQNNRMRLEQTTNFQTFQRTALFSVLLPVNVIFFHLNFMESGYAGSRLSETSQISFDFLKLVIRRCKEICPVAKMNTGVTFRAPSKDTQNYKVTVKSRSSKYAALKIHNKLLSIRSKFCQPRPMQLYQ